MRRPVTVPAAGWSLLGERRTVPALRCWVGPASVRGAPDRRRAWRHGGSTVTAGRLHVICERDVGLFSLIQQVIANVPWALSEGRVPIVHFGSRTCYWTPNGFRGRDNVWEYYFEPLVVARPAASMPDAVRAVMLAEPPAASDLGYVTADGCLVTSHFGDHPHVAGATLSIPYEWTDPDDRLRVEAKAVLDRFVRPRPQLQARADRFASRYLNGHHVIGVHARGTDAVSEQEQRAHRRGSLVLGRYVTEIERLLERAPAAKVFVATDDESSLRFLWRAFPDRVIAHPSLRHRDGHAAGQGPTGWLMPAYIASDPDAAARNGEEAIVEYLLLSRCNYLVHNGSSLARTVLLNAPHVPHTNTHTSSR
jgi:hypothetical protein